MKTIKDITSEVLKDHFPTANIMESLLIQRTIEVSTSVITSALKAKLYEKMNFKKDDAIYHGNAVTIQVHSVEQFFKDIEIPK